MSDKTSFAAALDIWISARESGKRAISEQGELQLAMEAATAEECDQAFREVPSRIKNLKKHQDKAFLEVPPHVENSMKRTFDALTKTQHDFMIAMRNFKDGSTKAARVIVLNYATDPNSDIALIATAARVHANRGETSRAQVEAFAKQLSRTEGGKALGAAIAEQLPTAPNRGATLA